MHSRFPKVPSLLTLGAVAALLASACADGANDPSGQGAAQAAPVTGGETPSPLARSMGVDEAPTVTDVTVRWMPTDMSAPMGASRVLFAELRNETDQVQQGRLVLVGSGLDGQLVERPLEEFQLNPRATKEVRVPVASLPVQSESSASFVVVQAEVTRTDGFMLRVPTSPLYFHFQGGYTEAQFYPADDVARRAPRTAFGLDQPLKRLRMQGRMQEADGRWTTVEAPMQSVGQGETGVSLVEAGKAPLPGTTTPAAPTAAPSEATGGVEKKTGALTATYTICGNWRVQFVDSGLGEDIFPSSAWQDVPAYFAQAYVYQNGGSVYWGKADASGCHRVTLSSNTTYVFYQGTANMGWTGGPVMGAYLMDSGYRSETFVNVTFTTPAAAAVITLKPTYNNDAVQVAAVQGATLRAQWLGDQGMKNGQLYATEIHSPYCGPASDPLCPVTVDGVVKVGVNVQQNSLMTHWKFMIGHEFGHAVQEFSMGAPYFAYTWTDAPELCRCSHVAELYGTGHCLQSRGPTGGAQIEGFAHAYSTRIWNKDSEANGIFVYYKPFKNPYVAGSPVWNPPITMTILSQTKFMANWCAQAGKGTELDWSQFFYQVTARQTINSTPMSNLFSIYRKACTGNVNSNCTYSHKISWENLRASAQSYWASNSIYNKFRDLGIATGVNY